MDLRIHFQNALLKLFKLRFWFVGFTAAVIILESLLAAAHSSQFKNAWSGVTSLLRNEINSSNSYQVARALSDMEKVGWIKCVTLTEISHDARTFYDTTTQSYCGPLSGRTSGDVSAINGTRWTLGFALPTGILFVILQLLTPLFVLFFVYALYQRTKLLEFAREQEAKTQQLQIERLEADTKSAQRQAQFAEQVAHDIRSPLSALNLVVSVAKTMPEDQRMLIQKAAQRINDIANGLLQTAKQTSDLSPTSTRSTLNAIPNATVIDIIETVVNEKRIQFGDRVQFEFQTDLSKNTDVVASINDTELSRVISNLINNSIEAFQGLGLVRVGLSTEGQLIKITIQDNGPGMSPEVLNQLGERGFSFGKDGTQSGSGLGVHHAKQTVERARGKFLVTSQLGKGTEIHLSLPRS